MDKDWLVIKRKGSVPFWIIALILALLGILSYQLTHDAAISELLFLILITIVIIKVVPAVLRLFAILTIVLIFILVMLAWAGTTFGS